MVIAPNVFSNTIKKPDRLSEEDWAKIRQCIIKEINALNLSASDIKADAISSENYDVINDLVEKMNKFDELHPDCIEDNYIIHCNYSGLGILNRTGYLEKNDYLPDFNRGYYHILWIPLALPGCRRG